METSIEDPKSTALRAMQEIAYGSVRRGVYISSKLLTAQGFFHRGRLQAWCQKFLNIHST